MKFSISRTNFLNALQMVIGVIPNRSTLHILTNLLIYTENGKLKLMGTDLELTMISSVDADIKVEGGIAVPAKILSDILKELPEDDLVFEVDESHRVLLTSKLGQYKISGESQNEFPPAPAIDGTNELDIPNHEIKRMIEKTTFATSLDELRPALTGVLMQLGSEETKMVATDGHRLVKIVNKKIKYGSGESQIILPTKALNYLQKNLHDNGTVHLTFNNAHALFKQENMMIFTKIISEDYPDFERALPTNNDKELFINTSDFISSVKRISLFASPMTNQIRVSLTQNQLMMSAEDMDVGGSASETIACTYANDDLEIGYNAIYLLDVLRHVDSTEIKVLLNTPLTGSIILPVEQENDEELTMLVMPVRLNDR